MSDSGKELDPLCPDRHEAAAYAAENGRQKARREGFLKEWGLKIGGGFILIVFVLPAALSFAVSYWWEGSRADRVLNAVTPSFDYCWTDNSRDCGPTRWVKGFFDGDEVVVETTTSTAPVVQDIETVGVINEAPDTSGDEVACRQFWGTNKCIPFTKREAVDATE